MLPSNGAQREWRLTICTSTTPFLPSRLYGSHGTSNHGSVRFTHASSPCRARKHAIDTVDMLDFLKEIVESVPDPSAGGTIDVEAENAEARSKKRGKGKDKRGAAADASNGGEKPAPKRRRKKAGDKNKDEDDEKEEREMDVEDDDEDGANSRRRRSEDDDDWEG